MAPTTNNKPCAQTHKDIWWLARAHQQDRDKTKPALTKSTHHRDFLIVFIYLFLHLISYDLLAVFPKKLFKGVLLCFFTF